MQKLVYMMFGLLHRNEWRFAICRLHVFLFGRKLVHVIEFQCCLAPKSVGTLRQMLEEGEAPQT